jgi:hypothetical protein
MINFYKCEECEYKVRIYADCSEDLKCPKCRHNLIGEPQRKTTLQEVLKQNGEAVLKEFMCPKCGVGPYFPINLSVKAILCHKCHDRIDKFNEVIVFPKTIKIK